MPCTATIPNLTAREQAHHLYEAIPPGLFRVADENERIAWRVSPEPFALSPEQVGAIERLGTDLLRFYRALNNLYNRSARGTAPAFIAEYLDRGKPEQIVKLARQNRFKQEVPGVIRPDLILTADGFVATELDSIPGGMGFLGAMTEAYCQLGIESLGGDDGIPIGFAAMLRHTARVEYPTVAIVVSDESADYRNEMSWLAEALRRLRLADAWLRRPEEITFTEEGLFIRHEDGREARLDALYRNFELFDLFNVPKQELMLYAARHNRVEDHAAAESTARRKAGLRAASPPCAGIALACRTGRRNLRTVAAALPANVGNRSSPVAAGGCDRGTASRRRAGLGFSSTDRAAEERTHLRGQTIRLFRVGVGLARRKGR